MTVDATRLADAAKRSGWRLVEAPDTLDPECTAWQRHRLRARAEGRCIRCGTDAVLDDGRCDACRADRRDQRAIWRSLGLCHHCGQETGGYYRCYTCRRHHADSARRRRARGQVTRHGEARR